MYAKGYSYVDFCFNSMLKIFLSVMWREIRTRTYVPIDNTQDFFIEACNEILSQNVQL